MTNPNINSSERGIEARVNDLLLLSRVVNQFMDVQRATIRDGRQETDGEHTLHLQFIAVAYASEYHPELNVGQVALYALIHDFIEVYAGDVNSLNASPETIARKAITERVAFDRLRRELGEAWPKFLQYLEEYETLASPEARFIKTLDKWDPSFSHLNDEGAALFAMGVEERTVFESHCKATKQRILAYGGDFPDAMAIRESLQDKVADVAYATV